MNHSPRVLHVVESFGGGVADAIASFAESTPQFEHHLLYSTRADAPISRDVLAHFTTAELYVDGHVRRVRQTHDHARRLRPTLMHAHSSFGGAYARLGIRNPRFPVVYTPHCYAFERTDTHKATNAAFRLAEWALSRKTAVVAACSPREAALARRLHRTVEAVYVPNVAQISSTTQLSDSLTAGFTVVGAGRIAAQKDSSAFAAVASQLSGREGFQFRWLGGGETLREAELEAAGVEVSGWLAKPELLAELSKADVYVHTAAWEGFPVGLLEAVALGIPALVLDRPYAHGLDPEMVCSDIDAIAYRVKLLADDSAAMKRLIEAGQRSFSTNSRAEQSRSLQMAYAAAQERVAS